MKMRLIILHSNVHRYTTSKRIESQSLGFVADLNTGTFKI